MENILYDSDSDIWPNIENDACIPNVAEKFCLPCAELSKDDEVTSDRLSTDASTNLIWNIIEDPLRQEEHSDDVRNMGTDACSSNQKLQYKSDTQSRKRCKKLDRPEKCETCNKTFEYPGYLEVHMRYVRHDLLSTR